MRGFRLLYRNYWVELYKHLLDLFRNDCEKSNYRLLAGIEPASLLQCVNLMDWGQFMYYYILITYILRYYIHIYHWGTAMNLTHKRARQPSSACWLECCTGIAGPIPARDLYSFFFQSCSWLGVINVFIIYLKNSWFLIG